MGDVNAREDGLKVILSFNDGKVEELEVGRRKNLMRGPVNAVFAFGIAVDEVVVEIRAGDIPEFPFAVVEKEIWFVDTSFLPRFVGDEDGSGLIDPGGTIPFEKTDGVGSPELFGGTGVIDALDPGAAERVPAVDISGAMTTSVEVPRAAAIVGGK